MISPVGSVLTVDIEGSPVRVQVISDGPTGEPSSAWAVTYGEGAAREYILVKKVTGLRGEPAKYMGRRQGQKGTGS